MGCLFIYLLIILQIFCSYMMVSDFVCMGFLCCMDVCMSGSEMFLVLFLWLFYVCFVVFSLVCFSFTVLFLYAIFFLYACLYYNEKEKGSEWEGG